jgi:hypothetical protein
VQARQPPAVPPVDLGPCRRGPWGSVTARSPGSARPCGAAAGPGRSRSGRPRSRLAASGDREAADEPAHRGLVVRDPLDLRAVAIWGPGSPPRWPGPSPSGQRVAATPAGRPSGLRHRHAPQLAP